MNNGQCVPKQVHSMYLNLIRFPLLSHLHAFAALIIQSQTIYDEFTIYGLYVRCPYQPPQRGYISGLVCCFLNCLSLCQQTWV